MNGLGGKFSRNVSTEVAMHRAQAVFSAAVRRPTVNRPIEITLLGEHRRRTGVFDGAGFLQDGEETAHAWSLVSTWSYLDTSGASGDD